MNLPAAVRTSGSRRDTTGNIRPRALYQCERRSRFRPPPGTQHRHVGARTAAGGNPCPARPGKCRARSQRLLSPLTSPVPAAVGESRSSPGRAAPHGQAPLQVVPCPRPTTVPGSAPATSALWVTQCNGQRPGALRCYRFCPQPGHRAAPKKYPACPPSARRGVFVVSCFNVTPSELGARGRPPPGSEEQGRTARGGPHRRCGRASAGGLVPGLFCGAGLAGVTRSVFPL